MKRKRKRKKEIKRKRVDEEEDGEEQWDQPIFIKFCAPRIFIICKKVETWTRQFLKVEALLFVWGTADQAIFFEKKV